MNRLYELDFIRGISIIAVVLIHTSASMLGSENINEISIVFGLILNQLSRFCVPAFLFVAGILAYKSLKKTRLKKFMRKRSIDLLLPYLFWSIVGLLIWGNFNPKNLVYTVLFGFGPFYQMYYVPVLFQLYLLVNLMKRYILNFRRLFAIFVITFLVFILYQLSALNIFGFKESGTINLLVLINFTSWIFYFSSGLLIGKYYKDFRSWIKNISFRKINIFLILSTVLLLTESYFNWVLVGEIKDSLLSYFRPVILLFSTPVILLLIKLGLKKQSRIIKQLNDKSFGIYLIHLAVLKIFEDYTGTIFLENIIGVIILTFITLITSYYLCLLLERLPLSFLTMGHHNSIRRDYLN